MRRVRPAGPCQQMRLSSEEATPNHQHLISRIDTKKEQTIEREFNCKSAHLIASLVEKFKAALLNQQTARYACFTVRSLSNFEILLQEVLSQVLLGGLQKKQSAVQDGLDQFARSESGSHKNVSKFLNSKLSSVSRFAIKIV